MKNTIILFAAITFAACTKGGDYAAPTGRVSLTLNMPGELPTPSATRALDFVQENTIADAYVLAFDNAGGLENIIKCDSLLTSTPNMNYKQGDVYSGAGSVTIKDLPPSLGDKKTNLVVLVNSEAVLNATIGTTITDATRGKSRDEVLKMVFATIDAAMYPGDGTIPMYGETGAFAVSGAETRKSIDLIRAVARIDVGVGQIAFNDTDKSFSWTGLDAAGNAIPLQITSVTVLGMMNQYSAAPLFANISGTRVTATSVPASATRFTMDDAKSKFRFAVSGNGLSRGIYVPEAVNAGIVGDANHLNRMALIVGGKYQGSATETYYRLDFAPDGKNVIDVLRNNCYFFNLSAVGGTGHPTVEEAAGNRPANITVDVISWTDSTMGNKIL